MEFKVSNTDLLCESCVQAKITKQRAKSTQSTRANQTLEVVHADLCGPMSTKSRGGALYFMVVVDDWSRYYHTYFLHHKTRLCNISKSM